MRERGRLGARGWEEEGRKKGGTHGGKWEGGR